MTVFKKIPWLVWLICLPVLSFSQNCGCDDCGILIPEDFRDTFEFEINDLVNNDLSDINQGICGVELHFQHFRVRGLEMYLISPNGNQVHLIGNNLPFPTITTTPGTDWDITFIPRPGPANPDGTFPNNWWNGNAWQAGAQYKGTYFPFSGDLSVFGSGPANGTWRLVIINWNPELVFTEYTGELMGFRLIFCDPTGISCCFAEAGEIVGDTQVEFCQGDDSLLLDPNLRITSPGDTNLYTFRWLIGQDTVLVKYDTVADLRTFPPGEYEVCGLSYLNADADSLWTPDGILRWDSLKSQIEASDTSFCADISNQCLKVIIKAPPGVTNLRDSFCVGDNYSIGDSTFSLPGNYDVFYQLSSGCDSLVQLELTQVVPDTTYLTETVCFDSTFSIGTTIYNSSGIYIDTFSGAGFCDSIVKLNLTVLPRLQTSISPVICQGDTFRIGTEKFYMPGGYQVNLISDFGCDSLVNIDLKILNPQAQITLPNQITCADPSILIDGSNSEPFGRIDYEWSTSGGNILSDPGSSVIAVSDSGTYVLTIRQDSAGMTCFVRDSVFVDLEQTLPSVQIELPDTLTCMRTQVVLDGSNSSQGTDYQYLWKEIGTGIIAGAVTNQLTVTTPGDYELVVINSRTGCRDSMQIEVIQDINNPIAEAGNGLELTCLFKIGQLIGTGSSTGSEFEYLWTGPSVVSGERTLMAAIDSAGWYYLEVNNRNTGCSSIDSVEVTENIVLPDADAGRDTVLNCRDSILQLNGVGNTGIEFSYSWSTPDGNIIGNANTSSVQADQPGIYVFRVLNTITNCERSDTLEIFENRNIPNTNAGSDSLLNCLVTQITLGGSGTDIGTPFSHQWYQNGTIISGANQPVIQVAAPGTYALEVINGDNFCRDTSYAVVGIDTIKPNAQAGIGFELNCLTLNDTLNAVTGTSAGTEYIFQWTGPSIICCDTGLEPVVDREGWYYLEVIDTSNFCSTIDSVEVTKDENLPTADAGSDQILNCRDDSFDLVATGSLGSDFQYSWTSPTSTAFSLLNDFSIRVDEPGRFVFSVTNTANLCVKTDTVEVFENKLLPNADAGTADTLNCLVTQIRLGGSGTDIGSPFSHLWYQDDVLLTGVNQPTVIVNEPGVYALEVINNDNFCRDTSFVDILQDTLSPNVDAGIGFQLNCEVSVDTLNAVSGTSSGVEFLYQWMGLSILCCDNSLEPAVDSAGWYYLEVTDASNFCSAVDSVEVTIDEEEPIAVLGLDLTLNCRGSVFNIGADDFSQGADFQFDWSSPSGSPFIQVDNFTITVDTAGVYVFSVTNMINRCAKTDTIEVFENKNYPDADAGINDTLTCLKDTIIVGGSGTSSGFGFLYQWFRNGTTLANETSSAMIVTLPGTYVLEVEDVRNFCKTRDTVEIIDLSQNPNARVSGDIKLDCVLTLDTLSAAGSDTGLNIEYHWTTDVGCINTDPFAEEIEIDCPGIYILEVRNSLTGCFACDTVTVTRDADVPTADAGIRDTLNCRDTVLVLNGQAMPLPPNSRVFWTALSGGNFVTRSDTLTPVIDAAGVYELTVFQFDNNCEAKSTVEIIDMTDLPFADAGIDLEINCDTAQVVLGGANSSSGSRYSYQWLDISGADIIGETQRTYTTNQPGSYILEVTDNLTLCRQTDTVSVTENIAYPLAEAGNGFVLNCTVDTFFLDGTSSDSGIGFEFEWATDTGQFIRNQSSLMPLIGADGWYFLTITNSSNGCSSVDSVFIDSDGNIPTAAVLDTVRLRCDGAYEVILNGTGSSVNSDIIYNWQGPAGANIIDANTLMPTVDAFGTYTLEVTDTSNNCSAFANVFVIDTISPQIIAPSTIQLDCDDMENGIMIDASGSDQGANYSFVWSALGAGFVTGENTLTPTIDNPGFYNLMITNNLNGCVSEKDINATLISSFPTVDLLDFISIECDSTTIILDGSSASPDGSITYQWTTTDGRILSGQNSSSVVVDSVGLYFLEITNPHNGCIAIDSILVRRQPCDPGVFAEATDTITCLVSQVRLDATASIFPDVRYNWSALLGTILADENTPTPLVTSGEYQLFLTDTINNLNSDTITVVVPIDTLHPVAVAAAGQLLTCRDSVVSLSGIGSSTGANIEYLWSGTSMVEFADSIEPSVRQSGMYEILVTDISNGCTARATTSVSEDISPPSADAGQNVMFPCDSLFVRLDGTGSDSGTDIFFEWNTGSRALQPEVNAPGEYCIFLEKLSNGCRDTACVQVIPDQDAPVIDALGADTITCRDTVFTLSASVNSANLEIAWTTDNGCIMTDTFLQNIDVNCEGNYFLTVKDLDNNCISIDTVEMSLNQNLPFADAGLPEIITCRDSVVQLSGTGDVGVDFEYAWTGNSIRSGGNTLLPRVDEQGVYYLEVRDAATGCIAVDSVTVTENIALPIADAGEDLEQNCKNKLLIISGLQSSTTGNYEWTTLTPGNILSGENTLEIEVDSVGVYMLMVTDDITGCFAYDTVAVTKNTVLPVLNLNTGNLEITCNQDTVLLSTAGSVPRGGLNYRWTTLTGNIINSPIDSTIEVDVPGWYYVSAERTDNNCIVSDSVFVDIDKNSPPVALVEPDTLTCNILEAVLEASVPDSVSNFEVIWNTLTGNFTADTDTLITRVDRPGRYSVLVTDSENGCITEVSVVVENDTILPQAEAAVATVLDCFNTSVLLNGLGSSVHGNRYVYQWATSGIGNITDSNTLNPTVDEEGVYTLTVRDLINGCEASDSVRVSKDESVIDGYSIDIQPVTCWELEDATIHIDSVTGGSPPYMFSLNGEPFVPFSQFSGLGAGDYHVMIQDMAGCETDTTIRIDGGTEILIDLGLDLTVLQGDSTELEALISVPKNTIEELTWRPDENFACKDCFVQRVAPLITTEYSVMAVDSNGCRAIDKVLITVTKDRPVYIPSGFSPNGDGDNDVFMIYGRPDLIKINTFQIFDRWGNIVHEAENVEPNNPDFGWDGIFKGKPMNENVFVYMAVIEFSDGSTEVFEGDLTLVR